MGVSYILSLIVITNFLCIASAFDPRPTQDICVADLKSPLRTNGPMPCKDPKTVTDDDFFHSGLDKPGNTSNPFRAAVTTVGVANVPGLNSMGLSMGRLDFGPGGYFPLHFHRASELHVVLEGAIEVGFVSPDQNYTYYSKILNKGDVFIVPPGLVHVQRNAGTGEASSLTILNAQNPGISIITHSAFGAIPAMDARYLADVYQLDENTIKNLQAKTWV
ncbi:putative germin-like protein 2-2 [Phtheirospermum japonicum]|uniref:Germin-like protein n=1 Tax=Phtheirospermum japonicum TaxID=374723 RepID=A0A830CBH9_9LAMI|nr:putative germin-like protein 2-2 [Phtheirospermum japonicum]